MRYVVLSLLVFRLLNCFRDVIPETSYRYFGDKLEMLVTFLTVLLTNILYIDKYMFIYMHRAAMTQKTNRFCHQQFGPCALLLKW